MKENWIKKHPIWTGVIGVFLLFILIGIFSGGGNNPPTNTQSSNSINIVKSHIPSDMKGKIWYSKEWEQKQLSETTWRVSVGSAIWKVSSKKDLCSETGDYVSICSDNGYAKTYSNLGYCKPDYICEK